jgi:hypothetical protein
MNANHYAVVVGINRYPELPNLNFARDDAKAFAAWLKKKDGGALPKENVKLIIVPDTKMPPGTPREHAKPIREQVEEALYSLRKKCQQHIEEHPEDWDSTRLYVYVSGHGIAPDPNEAALLMADSGPDWYGRNFSCAKYLTFFEKAQIFRELVFFADCCRDWTANAPPVGPSWTIVKGDRGRICSLAGYATHFGELAYEPDLDADSLRGYFTQALLEGLSGKAADPFTGEINSVNLSRFVTERVEELTKDMRYPQKPILKLDPATPLVFAKIDPQSDILQHNVSLTFVSDYNGKIKLLDGHFKKIGEHNAADGPWRLTLPNGLYSVEPIDGGDANPFQNQGMFRVRGGNIDVQL